MDDLIRRQDAIDAHCELCPDKGKCNHVDLCPDVEVFNLLQSVQPEHEYTMEEFMYGQEVGNHEDGSL